MTQIKLAIFASGSGTNAERFMEYFLKHDAISVACVVTNKPKAGVLERAKRFQVPTAVFNKEDFERADTLLKFLHEHSVDFIVLAGFLLKVSPLLINRYPEKIINIHPALLPKYGGKGMYGMNVHNAVIANKEKESGISIHLVNEQYDDGRLLFQTPCKLNASMTAEDLAQKIHQLEYKHFPSVVEEYIREFIK